MSECLKSFLLAKKNKNNQKRLLKLKNKPAEKNINYHYIESISYNLIENITMFKNNEISESDLNLRLMSNFSLLISKNELDKKIIKKNKKQNKNNPDIKKCSVQNYGIYFPTNRITCLDGIPINNDYSNKNNNNLNMHENNGVFLPLGRNFIRNKKKNNNTISQNKNKSYENSFELMVEEKNSKNTSFLNESENSYSFISEESAIISNKDLINVNNKELLDSSNKIVFKNLQKFTKYKKLIDYIECPLISKESNQEKYNNFMKLLDNADELFDINVKNNINNIHNENEINNESDKKLYIDNCQIINNLSSLSNINIEQAKAKNNLTLTTIIDNKKNNNDILFFNSSIKNDLCETLDKTSSSLNQNKIIDKNHEISSSLKKKYLKRMNEEYILLIHQIYMSFISNCTLAKSEYLSDIIIKKIFLQMFKTFLLSIGIDNKKLYEKILKTQIFSNKIISFDQFIQSFDIIIFDNDSENLKNKFSFLLNILSYNKYNEFLNTQKIKIFFDFLGCSSIYISDFCEMLGEKLVIRFKTVYRRDEEENILLEKFRLKKMIIILESFFDELQIDI